MKPLLNRQCVVFDIDTDDKDTAIYELVKQLKACGKIEDTEGFYENVLARESTSPTSIGYGIGLPHGKTDKVLEAGVCFGRLKQPITWDPDSGETATIILLLAVPEKEAGNTHLEILAKLSRKLMYEEFRQSMLDGDEDALFTLLTNTLEG